MEVEPTTGTPLDSEVAAIRNQLAKLRHRRSLLSATLLSSRSAALRLRRAQTASSRSSPLKDASQLASKQEKHNQENVYRTCAGVTAFAVQDPDPHAVDGGKVLGIRIEDYDSSGGAFERPYYVLLHRVGSGPQLKVHKHTVPPWIPLRVLAEKHLPAPREDDSGKPSKPQDLHGFVRALRRELVSYRKRVGAVQNLRSACVQAPRGPRARKGIVEVKAVDVAAREVEIQWADGALGRLNVGRDGRIERVVVRGKGARRRALERMIQRSASIEKLEMDLMAEATNL